MSKAENPIFKPGERVAGYFRDSGHEDQELSCDQQERFALDWCAAHGIVLSKIFRDDARKGSTVVGRQKFLEMMEYFRGDKKDIPETGLIIWKFARFARDQDDSHFYIAELRHRKFVVHSLKDNIPAGPMAWLFEAAIHWANEEFLRNLSVEVKRGLYYLVEVNKCVPGVPPRGIKRIPVVLGLRRDGRERIAHRWEPDPEYKGRVLQAFELKDRGASLLEIRQATGLYKNLNSYKTFFENKIWIGILEFGHTVIPDYCEPVIPVALFERVQARLREQVETQNVRPDHLHPRRKNSRFILSGLLFCPRCGSAISGMTSRDKFGNTSERYGCGRAKRRRDCDMPLIPKYALEEAVIDQLVEHVLQPETLEGFLKELHALDAGQRETLEGEQAELMTRLTNVKRALTNVGTAIEQAGPDAHLLTRLKELGGQQAELQSSLADIHEKLLAIPAAFNENGYVTPDLLELAREMRQALREGEDADRRAIIRSMVSKVSVDRYGKNIVGNIWFYPLLAGGSIQEDTENKIPLTENQGNSEPTYRRSRRVNPRLLRHEFKRGFVARIKNKPR